MHSVDLGMNRKQKGKRKILHEETKFRNNNVANPRAVVRACTMDISG